MPDVSDICFLLVVCLDEMIGTERGPQQKKSRGTRDVELGTPSFTDTCNTRGKRWHGTSYVRWTMYQESVCSMWCVFDEMIGTERGPQQKKGKGTREVELGTPSFTDTCNTLGKRWHGTSYIGWTMYQKSVFSMWCVLTK